LVISIIVVLFFTVAPIVSPLNEKGIITQAETKPGQPGEFKDSLITRGQPEIRVSNNSIFRGESALISIYPDDNITELRCDIFFSEDNSTWSSLVVRTEKDHFEADFISSNASSKGIYYFKGEVGNKSGGPTQKSGIAKIIVMNNRPTAIISIDPELVVAGYENTFNGNGSFDLDGNITDYFWHFGDNSTGVGLNVVHTYSMMGNYTVSLTVTDNEGGATTLSTSVAVVWNLLRINSSLVITFGEERTVLIGGEVKGDLIVEGNVEILISETTRRGLNTLDMYLKKFGKIDKIDGVETETWQEHDPDTGNVTDFWKCSFDSTELEDGEYYFEIDITGWSIMVDFEIDNEPPSPPFFFIGLGLFVLAALAGFIIEFLRRKKFRKILEDIGYESKDVFRYVPPFSLVSLFISLALLIFLFLVIINNVNSWLYGLLLLFGLAVSALFAHLSFIRKSSTITTIGALLCCGTGSLYFIAMFDYLMYALIGTVIFVIIACAEIFSYLMYNRNLIMFFQNREENTTSVATNMTLNAFDIYREREVPKGPRIVKPGQEKHEWNQNKFKAKIHGKISYSRFTTNEVKIGIFDVNDWERDVKVAGIMLAQFIKLMSRKNENANSVKIKLMTSDPMIREKKKLLEIRGFTKVTDEISSVETFRLDIT